MAKKHQTDLQCKETVYLTPELLLAPIREFFGGQIPLDPATLPSNPTGATFFCVEPPGPPVLVQLATALDDGPTCLIDGLSVTWSDYSGVFLNPPYGKVLKEWCAKIHHEAVLGCPILALLPCGPRFATRYFQSHILTDCLDAICFVSPRVKFLRPDGSGTQGSNPYDSAIWAYNCDLKEFTARFKHLGRVCRMEVMNV